MEHLSDDVLRTIVYSINPADRLAQMDTLIGLKQDGTITTDQLAELNALRSEAEALTERKAQAFALLKSRGYPPPSLDQLPAPTA